MPKYNVVFKGVAEDSSEAMSGLIARFSEAYKMTLQEAEERINIAGGVLFTFDDPGEVDKAKKFMEGLGAVVEVREVTLPTTPPPLPPQGMPPQGMPPQGVPPGVGPQPGFGPPPKPSGTPAIAIVAIAGFGCLVLVAIVGILAAIAIPDFLKFQAKAKQSEAKTNMGAIFTCQVAYFGENNQYGNTFEDINWGPEGNTRYSYFLPGEVIQARLGGPYQLPEGIETLVGETTFQAIAVGNIDNDDDLDVWMINDLKILKNLMRD